MPPSGASSSLIFCDEELPQNFALSLFSTVAFAILRTLSYLGLIRAKQILYDIKKKIFVLLWVIYSC